MADRRTNQQDLRPYEEQNTINKKIKTERTIDFSNVLEQMTHKVSKEQKKEETKQELHPEIQNADFSNEEATTYIHTKNALLSLLATLREQDQKQQRSKSQSKVVTRLEPLIQSGFESALHTIDDAITEAGCMSLIDYNIEGADSLSSREKRSLLLSKNYQRLKDSIDKKSLKSNKLEDMNSDVGEEEEQKFSKGEISYIPPANYYQRMEITLANNQVYNEIKAYVESGKNRSGFASSMWLAEGEQWTIERNKIEIRHNESLPEMRPKLFNSILGRLKYAYHNGDLSSKVHKILESCGTDVINFLIENFSSADALLYLFNMSRGLADSGNSISNFRKSLVLIEDLSEVGVRRKVVLPELDDLQSMAFYFYKLILETPLIYNAVGRLFTEEVNVVNGYRYDFDQDNSSHMEKILSYYRDIKIVITNQAIPFYGMVGRGNEVYINVERIAHLKNKRPSITKRAAKVMQVIFHEATHSAIRRESRYGYAGYTHSPKRPKGSDSVLNTVDENLNETKKDKKVKNLEAGYRFENYVFGAHNRNFAGNDEFAKRMLLREFYMNAVRGSESRLFSDKEAEKLTESKRNYQFSGIRCGLPNLGPFHYR